MKKRHFCLLVNPTSNNGNTRHWIKKVEKKLSMLPLSFYTVITESALHAKEMAKQAIEQGEHIAVMGGDGSIRAIAAIANELKGTLALIPTGRGNDLARTLNISLDPLAACETLAYGKEIKIDMGQVNQEPFLGICSLGFDSIANRMANQTKWIKSKIVYLYAGLRTLINWKPIRFHLTIDGVEIEHIGYTVAVANSKCYGGGMYIAPNASIQDGLFDIVLIGNIPKWRFLINIPRVFKRLAITDSEFKIIRGREIKIEADAKFILCADGDLISAPPAAINILPQTLRFLV